MGVAISVTTVPAAAYTGAAAALHGYQDAGGRLLVLLTNVVGILAASTATVWVQRRLRSPSHAGTPTLRVDEPA